MYKQKMNGCHMITMFSFIFIAQTAAFVIDCIRTTANKTIYHYLPRYSTQMHTGESSCESPVEVSPIYHYRRMPSEDIENGDNKFL